MIRRTISLYMLGFLCLTLAAHGGGDAVRRYVFTGEVVRIRVQEVEAEHQLAAHVSTITRGSFGPAVTRICPVKDGFIEVKPLREGIHVVSLGPPADREVRFLAMDPPQSFDAEVVRRRLPRTGEKLLKGKSYTILTMGDSVTHTGNYEKMLVKMLERATGNENITFVDRSYAGRSVDASVRHFARDTSDIDPDLGLLMYGLNDQICFVPLRAFLAQYEWISDAMKDRFDGDTIFLQPTPHIAQFGPSAFRTIGFAEAVSRRGRRLDLPVARTFNGIWGDGGKDLARSVLGMWSLYPRHHRARFTTLWESRGKGDTIHPNALGHLRIARAVFDAITGRKRTPPLRVTGESRWTPRFSCRMP